MRKADLAETIMIAGVTWSDGSPRVRLRRDREPSVLVPVADIELNYRAGPRSPRRCVGHQPFRRSDVEWVDCDNVPVGDGTTCDRCSAVNATFASQLHHAHLRDRGELDPAVVAHIEKPNELYLAAFRDGSVKVGTSTAARLGKRLAEQGAWCARSVAHAEDGVAVRVLEDRVTNDLGIPQAVSARRKLDGFVRPRRDASLHEELGRLEPLVHGLVDELADDRLSETSGEWAFPGLEDDHWIGLHRYPLRLATGAHDVSLVAACGRFVVLARPGLPDRFIADLQVLAGIELELGCFESDALAVQDTLF